MLDELRSHAGSFAAKLLLALLVLSFAVWGIGDMVRHPGRNMAVGTVGDQTISLNDYQRAMRRETENAQRVFGDKLTPEIAKTLRLSDRALHTLINEALLKEESEALGIIPSDADVVRRIRSNPNFQDSKGNFDKNIFEAMLHNAGLTEKTYIEQLRENIASGLVMETLVSSIPVPQEAERALYAERQEQRTAILYFITPAMVSNLPAPDDAQVQAYYKDHQQAYSAPEYRSLSYVSFKNEDVRAKAAIPQEDLLAAYKERVDEFKHPESRTVDQLLYSREEQAKQAYDMLKSGTSFEQVAKSTDILNKSNLSLGSVERGHIVEAAEEPVFALKAGEFTQPIQSPFGWHVFRVAKIKEPSVASFDEVRETLEKDLRQHANENALTKMTNTLEDALAGGSSLKEAAADQGLKVHTLEQPIDRQGRTPQGAAAKDIPSFDKFMDVAFKTEEKSESSVTATKGGIYYIVRVEGITPEHVRPLAEVRAQVLADLQKEQRAKHLAELADTITKKMADKKANPVAEYHLPGMISKPFKRSSKTAGDVALPPSLVSDIFMHAHGEPTHAYPTANGEYIIATVLDIIPQNAKPQEKELADIHQELQANMQNEITMEYMRSLVEKYPLSINDSLIDSLEK